MKSMCTLCSTAVGLPSCFTFSLSPAFEAAGEIDCDASLRMLMVAGC